MRRFVPVPLLALLLLQPALPAPALSAQDPSPVEGAAALVRAGRFEEARRLLEPHARAHPDDARAAFLLGRALVETGDAEGAVGWLERAVRLDDGVADAHYWLGSAYGTRAQAANVLGQARLAGRAKGELERAVALDPEHLDARAGLVQFHLLAPRIMGGNRDEARRQAEEIARRDPYRGARARATVLLSDGDAAGAAARYEAILGAYPDSASLHVALGLVYDRLGRHADALALYDRFLRRHPGDPAILYQVGRTGAVSGLQPDRAEEALRLYLAHRPGPGQPSLAAAHWRLGMLLEKRGRPEEAREEYRAAVALDPGQREARAALKKLGGL